MEEIPSNKQRFANHLLMRLVLTLSLFNLQNGQSLRGHCGGALVYMQQCKSKNRLSLCPHTHLQFECVCLTSFVFFLSFSPAALSTVQLIPTTSSSPPSKWKGVGVLGHGEHGRHSTHTSCLSVPCTILLECTLYCWSYVFQSEPGLEYIGHIVTLVYRLVQRLFLG